MSARCEVISIQQNLVTETCFNCGVLFAMAEELYNELRRTKRLFYCPNGHSQYYVGKSDAQKAREAEQRAASALEEARIAQIEADRQREKAAKATRALKASQRRAAAAVCPCCQRSFVQLRRHMASKHPEHLAKHGIK